MLVDGGHRDARDGPQGGERGVPGAAVARAKGLRGAREVRVDVGDGQRPGGRPGRRLVPRRQRRQPA